MPPALAVGSRCTQAGSAMHRVPLHKLACREGVIGLGEGVDAFEARAEHSVSHLWQEVRSKPA